MSNSKAPTEVQKPSVRSSFAFDSMEEALAAFSQGEFLVVMDNENRENEGDLIMAGSLCTTEKMAWMIKHTRYTHLSNISQLELIFNYQISGFICVALPGERLDQLDIPPMFPENQERHRTAYTVTVDHKIGTVRLFTYLQSALTWIFVRYDHRHFSTRPRIDRPRTRLARFPSLRFHPAWAHGPSPSSRWRNVGSQRSHRSQHRPVFPHKPS